MTVNIDIRNRMAQLLARRRELTRRLTKIEADLEATPDPDYEERASQRENDEVLEGLGIAGQKELEAIDAALKRIEDGNYGICAICHGPIAPRRLEAVPAATLCQTCAQ